MAPFNGTAPEMQAPRPSQVLSCGGALYFMCAGTRSYEPAVAAHYQRWRLREAFRDHQIRDWKITDRAFFMVFAERKKNSDCLMIHPPPRNAH